jgi:16S rRNA C1402 N4-methylase RsmH
MDLVDILVKYGDLNFTEAKLAAKKIEESKPIKTTFQLRDAVVGCFQTNKTKKIAQVFQALRIATNR